MLPKIFLNAIFQLLKKSMDYKKKSLNKLNRNDVNSALEKLELIAKEKQLDNEMLFSLFNTTSSYDAFSLFFIYIYKWKERRTNKLITMKNSTQEETS